MAIEIDMIKLEQQAKLSLLPDERAETEQKLRQTLNFLQTLARPDVPVAQDARESVLRADEPTPSLPLARLLRNAPEQRDDCFVLPRVLE